MRLINLTPLHEIDFRNQAAFDTYNKQHKLRPDTKVNVAGKNTTAGKAAQSSAPVKGTSVFGGGDKKPFSGGVDVLDTVQKLLPVGTGFTDKKTGNKILIKGYKDNDMLVSHDKYPNKILKWPLKQFFKLDTKRFQFHPKPKEKLSRFPGGKEYPTFGNPLEGFPTEYKELLKKLQRSNNSNERTKLIDKMNVIRKKLNLIPLTNILKK